MQKIKLLVPIICFLFTCIIRYTVLINIKFLSNNFSVTLNNNSDDFKESKLLSLFLCKMLTIDLNEFKKNRFDKRLSFLNSLINIHQSHNAIINQSCWNDIITKVDQLHQSPTVCNCSLLLILSWRKKNSIEFSPLFYCVISTKLL